MESKNPITKEIGNAFFKLQFKRQEPEMKSRLFAFVLIAVGALGIMPATGQAQNPGRVAQNACAKSVTGEVRAMFPQAQRVQFLGGGNLRQVSNAETGVSGAGQFDSRSGWTRFSYSCIYNIRNGATYALNVRGGGTPSKHKPSAGKVAGAVIGTAIAVAIIEATSHGHKHHDGGGSRDWFSPVDGVKCSTSQSICYGPNGSVSNKWTRRVFINNEYAN